MRKFSKVQRVSESGVEYARGTPGPSYLNDVVQAHQTGKTIVDIQRERQKAISSYLTNLQKILNNKPVYSSVDEAVTDMRERTGLNKYLSRMASRNSDGSLTDNAKKNIISLIASNSIPDVFNQDKYKETFPKIEEFLTQKIKTRNGNVDASALQEEVCNIYNIETADALSSDIREYIQALIDDYKSVHGEHIQEPRPMELAEDHVDTIDDGNSNFFRLMENKGM